MKLILRRDASAPEFVFCQCKNGKTYRTEDILLCCIVLIILAMVLLVNAMAWQAYVVFSVAVGFFAAVILRDSWHDPRRK